MIDVFQRTMADAPGTRQSSTPLSLVTE